MHANSIEPLLEQAKNEARTMASSPNLREFLLTSRASGHLTHPDYLACSRLTGPKLSDSTPNDHELCISFLSNVFLIYDTPGRRALLTHPLLWVTDESDPQKARRAYAKHERHWTKANNYLSKCIQPAWHRLYCLTEEERSFLALKHGI